MDNVLPGTNDGAKKPQYGSNELNDINEITRQDDSIMYPDGAENQTLSNFVNNTPSTSLPSTSNATTRHQCEDSGNRRAFIKELWQSKKVEIIEPPETKNHRFRYKIEGRPSSLQGVNSTVANKTFPSIRVVGHEGMATVVVSCVTKDKPYRQHPHYLVGDDCKNGVFRKIISDASEVVVFRNLGIQCVKKDQIETSLIDREKHKVDPFNRGFDHKSKPSSIDLTTVRLCFQVFVDAEIQGKPTVTLRPVVSDPIYDSKIFPKLVICELSHCTGPVTGNRKLILLCTKVFQHDIKVRFFQDKNGVCVWEDYGLITKVHSRTAVVLTTPAYCRQDVTQPIQVFVQLQRPLDNAASNPVPFELLPIEKSGANRKRKLYDSNVLDDILKLVQAPTVDQNITPSPSQQPVPLPPICTNSSLEHHDSVNLFSSSQQQQQQMFDFVEPLSFNPVDQLLPSIDDLLSQVLPHCSQNTPTTFQKLQLSASNEVMQPQHYQQPPLEYPCSNNLYYDFNFEQPSTSTGGKGCENIRNDTQTQRETQMSSSVNLLNQLTSVNQPDPEGELTTSFTRMNTSESGSD